MRMETELVGTGVFRPDQIALVQAVFKEVIAEPWFDRSGENPKRLAKTLIEMYRRDQLSRDMLKLAGEAVAKERFSLGSTGEQSRS